MSAINLFPFWFFTLLSLLFTSISSEGQELGDTVSQAGLFSYQAPKGWAIKSTPMSKYNVAVDAPRNNFAANINVVVEPYPKSLTDYVSLNKETIPSSPYTHFEIVDEQPFERSIYGHLRCEFKNVFASVIRTLVVKEMPVKPICLRLPRPKAVSSG
jgi:hypothetical protein